MANQTNNPTVQTVTASSVSAVDAAAAAAVATLAVTAGVIPNSIVLGSLSVYTVSDALVYAYPIYYKMQTNNNE
jgi:hypothetical protein